MLADLKTALQNEPPITVKSISRLAASPDFSILIRQLVLIISNIRTISQPARSWYWIFATKMLNLDSEKLANGAKTVCPPINKLSGCVCRHQKQGSDT